MKKALAFVFSIAMVFGILGTDWCVLADSVPEPPSGNALAVTSRMDRNHGPKLNLTPYIQNTGDYYFGAYIKLIETPASYEYMRLAIQITYTDAGGTPNKITWKTTGFSTLSADAYTLVSGNINIGLAGCTITDAYIYVDTYNGSTPTYTSGCPGSKAGFYMDAAFFCKGTSANYESNLLPNGQFEYNGDGVVTGYSILNNAVITNTEPFSDQKTVNPDGSVTYAAGLVDTADTNIRLIGHWTRSAMYLKGYFQSSLELRFTGTSIRVMVNAQNLFYKIDDGQNTKLTSTGNVTLATGLEDGEHVLRLCSNYQDVKPVISGFKLDAGASTLPPTTSKSIMFIGDSITVSYFGSGYTNGFIDGYGVKTADALGLSYAGTAHGGIAIVAGEGSPDTSGIPQRFFNLGDLNSDGANTAYDTSSYQPDYISICLGTNGSDNTPAVQSADLGFLENLREAYPYAVIFCVPPFANKNHEVIQAAVEARVAAGDHKVHYIDSTGWIDVSASGVTSDGTHPVPASHTIIAQKLSAAIQALITPVTHSITVTQPSAGGEISVSAAAASAGDTITVTATPAGGYQLKSILVDGEAITGYTFTMPDSDVTVSD